MIIENFLVTKRVLFLKSSKWHQVFNTKKRSQNSSNLNMQLLYFSKQSSRHGKGCYFVRTKTIICMRYANPIIANLQQARKKTLKVLLQQLQLPYAYMEVFRKSRSGRLHVGKKMFLADGKCCLCGFINDAASLSISQHISSLPYVSGI